MKNIIPTIIGTAGSILQNQIQNQQSKENIEHAAAVNYGYGEMAANSADARARALFKDLYSPEAKVKQLKDAGLSVGLMYGQGGAGGTSSTAGAMGQGAGGQQAKQPLGILQSAELGLMLAQAKKLNAEAEDKSLDVKMKQREWEWSEKHAVEEVTINVNNERITELRNTGLSKWEIKRELEYKRDKAFDYLQKNRFDNENWLEVYRGITNQDSKDNIIEEYKSKLNLLKNQELQSEFETKLQEYKKKSITDLLDLMKNGIDTGNKTVDAVLKSAIPILVMSMLKQ